MDFKSNNQLPDHYHLALVLEESEFTGVIQGENGQIHLVWLDEPRTLLSNIHEVYKSAASSLLQICTPFTLVPATSFNVHDKYRIANETIPYLTSSRLGHFIVDEIAGVYVIPDHVSGHLVTDHESWRLQHTFEVLYPKHREEKQVLVAHWTRTGLFLMAIDDTLQFANYYEIQSVNDAIYYVLAAYKYSGLNPLIHPLVMSGRLTRDGEIAQKMMGFVKDYEWPTHADFLGDIELESHLIHHLI